MKRLFIPLLVLFFLPSFAQIPPGTLERVNGILPSEKIYIHTDRTWYSTTDDVFFKVYVLNGETHLPTSVSTVVCITLLDGKGSIKEKKELPVTNGTAAGCFSFNSQNGGIYKIKAFTNWTGNLTEEYIFEKEITLQKTIFPSLLLKMETEKKSYLPGQTVNGWIKVTDLDNTPVSGKKITCSVLYNGKLILTPSVQTGNDGKGIISFILPDTISQNDVLISSVVEHKGKTESVNKPVIIDLEEISVDFLPEGGNLVNGLPCNVAFRALKSNGKPADIKGKITDESGNEICRFESLKFGMGKFLFTPVAGKTYFAWIDSKKKNGLKLKLPESTDEGISVQCNTGKENTITVYSPQSREIVWVVQQHGKLLRNEIVRLEKGANTFPLKTGDYSPGIVQLTLFDNTGGIPLAERLIFVNKTKTLSVKITTGKEKYAPFEKVEMKIKVIDDKGKPVKGNFSLSVADEKNLTLADDKQDNILSHLLMSSELKGKIEEPNFYFKSDEPLADDALDLVMLTHGWRRYSWNDLLAFSESDWKGKIKFEAEKKQYSGRIGSVNYYNKNPFNKLRVSLPEKNLTATPDSNGIFVFSANAVSYPAKVKIKEGAYTETFSLNERQLSCNNARVTYNPLKNLAVFGSSAVVPEISNTKQRVDATVDLKAETITLSSANITTIPAIKEVELATYLSTVGGVDGTVYSLKLSEVTIINYVHPYGFLIPGYSYSWTPSNYTSSDHRYHIYDFGSNNTPYNKEFYSPAYTGRQTDYKNITDTRTTLYWQNTLTTNSSGEAEVSFYNAQNISSYRAVLEGTDENGNIGRGEDLFYTQKPLTVEAKFPLFTTQGDNFTVKCVVSNHTPNQLETEIEVFSSADFTLKSEEKKYTLIVPADSFLVTEIDFEVARNKNASYAEKDKVRQAGVTITSGNLSDKITQNITVNNRGFEHYATMGGNEKRKTFTFTISEPIDQQMTAGFEMILNPYAEMEKTLAGMIREPGGCFEQVSASNYPNILALQYLQKNGKADPELTQKAMNHLASGYKQLAKYETSQGGFEWYGHTPPHEALTAMGLMQFHEMKKLGVETDDKLFDRTVKWLMGRKTKSGVFEQNQGKYGFSGAPRETASAYITYALACIGEKSIDNEIKAIQADIDKNFDFYKAALLANIYFKTGETENGKKTVKHLVDHVRKNSIEKIKTGASVTYNYTPYLECIALLSIAIAENNLTDYREELDEYVKYIYSKRTYYGSFGNTQTTVLCLQAIIAKKLFNGTNETKNGSLAITINDHPPVTLNYGNETDIRENNLGQFLKPGKNTVKIASDSPGENVPYYNFNASWKEVTPGEGDKNKVNITTSFSQTQFKTGEAARMNVMVENITDNGLPQTIAIIGTPAGLSFDGHELKRLAEDKVFDYYELKDNYLVLYYAELAPKAKISIPLNLKAELKGTWSTPPACAYLYYNDANKSWCRNNPVVVE